jgi:hypothetical protein
MSENPYEAPQTSVRSNDTQRPQPVEPELWKNPPKKLLLIIVAFAALLLLGAAAFSVLARILWLDYPVDW